MVVKLQRTLSIDMPEDLYFEYDYASSDGSKPGVLHLTGNMNSLRSLLEVALALLNEETDHWSIYKDPES